MGSHNRKLAANIPEVRPLKSLCAGKFKAIKFDPVLATMLFALFVLYSLLPLRTALEFGGDEGIELMKGLLVSKGYSLYTQIWNDQPPILTLLLGGIFHVFGPSVLAARLLATAFGLGLYLGIYHLVKLRSKRTVALASVFFLIASPMVFKLSCSVMLEVPAFAMGIGSACCLFAWGRTRRWYWLFMSGVGMGIALQIKLSAVLVAPAICLEIVAILNSHVVFKERKSKLIQPSRYKTVFRSIVGAGLIWSATTMLVFLTIAFIFARGSLASSWKSHTGTQIVTGYGSPSDFPFDAGMFLHHPECLAGATVAVILLIRQKRWFELRFPLVLLVTAFAFHTFRRPWWPYYYLHFAIPLAWLSGIALVEILRQLSQVLKQIKDTERSTAKVKFALISLMVGLGLVLSEMRLEGNVRKLRASPKINENQIVQKMCQFGTGTHWAYSQSPIYAFHAGVSVPPELAVVVLKRFWSGQITTHEIVEVCRKYKPDQLLLVKSRSIKEWRDLLVENYVEFYKDEHFVLYVTKHSAGAN
jgi:4-amino-4-deoxy-L-arabinose transferase-like glycosyltransferase